MLQTIRNSPGVFRIEWKRSLTFGVFFSLLPSLYYIIHIYIKLVRMHVLDARISLKMIRQTVSCVVVVVGILADAHILRALAYIACVSLSFRTRFPVFSRAFNSTSSVLYRSLVMVLYVFHFRLALLRWFRMWPMVCMCVSVHLKNVQSVCCTNKAAHTHTYKPNELRYICTWAHSHYCQLPLTCERMCTHTHMPKGK